MKNEDLISIPKETYSEHPYHKFGNLNNFVKSMPKVWNIGNTTVRNPKRIENALKVFVEEGFSGNAKGSEVERRLHSKLKERDVLEFEGDPSDWNGRKWRAAFYQLGFISFERYKIEGDTYSTEELFRRINAPAINVPYQLTIAGEKLISADTIPKIEDIYTRQFACYELPNSLETGFHDGKMKPFILFLQVLTLLQDAGMAGLNKFETGLFIQKFRDHTSALPQEIFSEISAYRAGLNICKNTRDVKAFKQKYLDELAEFSGIKPLSVVGDYADTTFRYFNLSGLFTRIGETIVIRPNKRDFVNRLLQTEPVFYFNTQPFTYFEKFNNNSYIIPTDELVIALGEITFLSNGIRNRQNPLLEKANELTVNSNADEIQEIRYELIEYNNWEREEDFANEQQSEEAIKSIIKYLKVLNSETVENSPEIDDRPAFLEWAVWRSFLAINEIVSPIHETRRFPLDQDFMPRNTAPGGGSDLLFEFDSYVLVVEVTMTTSHRQMAVESEPVRRHTVKYKELFPNKDVYCLFLAPSVDNNVAETFRIGVWYKLDVEEFVDIIPMSLSDFINAIDTLLHKRFKNSDFLSLLHKCLALRNVRAPRWKQGITQEIAKWKMRVMS